MLQPLRIIIDLQSMDAAEENTTTRAKIPLYIGRQYERGS
jgi:hypothetical protein